VSRAASLKRLAERKTPARDWIINIPARSSNLQPLLFYSPASDAILPKRVFKINGIMYLTRLLSLRVYSPYVFTFLFTYYYLFFWPVAIAYSYNEF
jgi:hypothetical protein